MNLMDKAYAVLHIPSGKLVSNLTNPPRLFWVYEKKAQEAINKNTTIGVYHRRKYEPGELRVVSFSYDGVML